jgi:hypothetical protein
MCGAAARGLWIDMICIMHEATPYGHLRVHGQPPNVAQLAALTGMREQDLPELIAELERHGVFSRTREGVIYSRKLVRMDAKSAKARKNGKKGGNPAITPPPQAVDSKTESDGRLTLKDKGDDKPQKPEARSQIYSDDKSSASEAGERDSSRNDFGDQIRALVALGIPEVRARALIGKWRSEFRDDAAISGAFAAFAASGAVDPVAWISARLASPPPAKKKNKGLPEPITPEVRMESLRRKAEWAKQGSIPPTLISNTDAAEMLHHNLITKEELKKAGIQA